MKHKTKQCLYLIAFSILLFSCGSIGKLGNSTKIERGTILKYIVNEASPYDVYVRAFEKDSIEFKYQFDDPEAWGIIQMNDWALEFGPNLKNYFPEYQETLNLEEQTAVWVARDIFRKLKQGMEVGMSTGFANSWKLKGSETYSFEASDGENYDLPVIVITDATESQEIWIHDDIDNPLIVMMMVDFRIELVDVSFTSL